VESGGAMLPLSLTEGDKKKYDKMIWADFWRDLFAENTSLVHVDFSHNNLEK